MLCRPGSGRRTLLDQQRRETQTRKAAVVKLPSRYLAAERRLRAFGGAAGQGKRAYVLCLVRKQGSKSRGARFCPAAVRSESVRQTITGLRRSCNRLLCGRLDMLVTERFAHSVP